MASELLATVREFLFPERYSRPSIAPMDAGLTPNDRLQNLAPECVLERDEPEGVEFGPDGSLLVTEGNCLLAFDPQGTVHEVAKFTGAAGPVVMEPAGTVLVGVAGEGVIRVTPQSGQTSTVCERVGSEALRCPTDLAVAADGSVFCTDGSTEYAGEDWVHDLMEQNRTGRLVRIDPATGSAETVASGLAWPSGVSFDSVDESLIVCEAWAHRIARRDLDGSVREVLRENFPGYPGRITTDADGSFWLAVFALRTQLVDFVLTQRDFVSEMMRTIEPDYWIRPALRSLNSGLEPLQGGQIRKLGVIKPWAPPRSYGLVVHLDAAGRPIDSLHSRGGGDRHGVTSVRAVDDRVAICVRGGRQVLVCGRNEL